MKNLCIATPRLSPLANLLTCDFSHRGQGLRDLDQACELRTAPGKSRAKSKAQAADYLTVKSGIRAIAWWPSSHHVDDNLSLTPSKHDFVC